MVPSSLCGGQTCPLGTALQHGGCRMRWYLNPRGARPPLPDRHPWVLNQVPDFYNFWGRQGAVGPAVLLATPCTPRAAHGSAGTACKELNPTAGGSNCNSPLAGFPGLPYGSRCLEFEPWAEPGGKSSG